MADEQQGPALRSSAARFLCLDEDFNNGGTGVRCAQQCAACRDLEDDLERGSLPPDMKRALVAIAVIVLLAGAAVVAWAWYDASQINSALRSIQK